MGFRYLDSAVMLQLSATWLDSTSDAHNTLVALPDLNPFLARLNKPHSSLAALLQPGMDVRISAISKEQFEIDIRHDGIIRGVFTSLSGAAELLRGEAQTILLQLRDFLVPDGLSSTQKSYRAEATQAAQLKDRITPAIKAQLDSIQIGMAGQSQPLSHFVDEWISLGKKLGLLEDEKARIQDSPAETTAQATVKARNLWIRTVNALIAQAELVEIDEATDRLLFGPLRAAVKNAERKSKGKSSDATAAGSSEPTTTPSTTDHQP
jgi:hypothetical protein